MIKNLIFDIGDVLIEYRWGELFQEYGISMEEGSRIGQNMLQTEIWSKGLDCGNMTTEEAIAAYEKLYPKDVEIIARILRHGENMAVPRPEIWEKVGKLKEKGYQIYLLSNYSEDLFQAHTGGAAFWDIVDGAVISYQVHVAKPDEGIYRALLEGYGLQAEECLFFDDRAENVAGAEKVGISAKQVLSREMLNVTLDELLSK